MTERGAPPEWGFDYRQDDPYPDDGWFGREPVAEPTYADEIPDRPPAGRPAAPTVNTWTVNGQLRASDTSTLTFRPTPAPWYRTKQATIALIAVASAVVAVPLVMLALRGSTQSAPEESTSIAPQASTSAQPAPSAQPTPTNAPPAPPLPPPPPPPTEDTTDSAPSAPWTRQAVPPSTEKPDVAPTPVTRAPISVAPVPRQPPENSLATPGGRRPHWGPW